MFWVNFTVAVGKGQERVGMIWVEDTFVGDETIGLVPALGEQVVCLVVAHDLVTFLDGSLAGLTIVGRLKNFGKDVVLHDGKVQLLGSFTVECEASELGFDLTVGRPITVILGTARTKFDDVMAFQLVLELT